MLITNEVVDIRVLGGLALLAVECNRSLLSCDSQQIENLMSLSQRKIITKEIESWKIFADGLKSKEDKQLFLEMLKCEKYSVAINAKGKPFPSEPLIMALLLEQHIIINWLENKIGITKQRFFKCSKGE